MMLRFHDCQFRANCIVFTTIIFIKTVSGESNNPPHNYLRGRIVKKFGNRVLPVTEIKITFYMQHMHSPVLCDVTIHANNKPPPPTPNS